MQTTSRSLILQYLKRLLTGSKNPANTGCLEAIFLSLVRIFFSSFDLLDYIRVLKRKDPTEVRSLCENVNL